MSKIILDNGLNEQLYRMTYSDFSCVRIKRLILNQTSSKNTKITIIHSF